MIESNGITVVAADRFRHIEFRGRSNARRPLCLPPSRTTARARTVRIALPDLLEPGEQDFCQWLLAQGGIDQSQYRPRPLRRRLSACYRALRVGSAAEARARLQREPALIPMAISSIVIGVTAFFRDDGVFDALCRDVLPQLLKARPSISIWSAGCSDGAELYSMAMLLSELGGLRNATLLGTDCRAHAVAAARCGEFDFSAAKPIDPALRERYFEPSSGGNKLRVSPLLRSACRWQTADILACTEAPAWDVVLCRNMAIYLEPYASAELWRRLVGTLRPGGYLVVGKAERPCRHLPLQRISACVYRHEEEC
jgi:chemotaxis methyl-accepting protein methylase